jgi:hypothetical protein
MKDEPVASKKLFSVGGNDAIQATRSRVRATAAATVEPIGARDGTSRREHLIKVVVELNQADAKTSNKAEVIATTLQAMAAYGPKAGEPDRRETREVSATRRNKSGATTTAVVAIEGKVVWPGRPSAASIDALSSALLEEGYRVAVRERRECLHASCTSEAMVEWNETDEVPDGWISGIVCGRHTYKSCGNCQSTYLCTATNAAGQASSVYCTVCDAVLIEWGSSKVWDAQLVARGEGAVAARNRRRNPAG